MLVEDLEASFVLLSLLRFFNQWHQLGLLMATESTMPSMKIGTMMSPQSGAYEEGLELVTSGISYILHDYTVLANAVQDACFGMCVDMKSKGEF